LESSDLTDIVDVVRRGDDADVDEGADKISVVGTVDEFAADRSAMVGDEATDVAVDEVATAAGPEKIRSEGRRTPPVLMLRWTLPIARSILPHKPEKAEHDVKVWG
jgi:hypothetical protein